MSGRGKDARNLDSGTARKSFIPRSVDDDPSRSSRRDMGTGKCTHQMNVYVCPFVSMSETLKF